MQAAAGARERRINTFAGTILDRVSEHRDDLAWVAARLAEPDTRFIVVGPSGETLKVANGDAPLWLDHAMRQQHLAQVTPTLLGVADGRAYFMLVADAELEVVKAIPAAAGLACDGPALASIPSMPASSPTPRDWLIGRMKPVIVLIAARRGRWWLRATACNAPTKAAVACIFPAPTPRSS